MDLKIGWNKKLICSNAIDTNN